MKKEVDKVIVDRFIGAITVISMNKNLSHNSTAILSACGEDWLSAGTKAKRSSILKAKKRGHKAGKVLG